jgi:hypothetical protein
MLPMTFGCSRTNFRFLTQTGVTTRVTDPSRASAQDRSAALCLTRDFGLLLVT